MFQHTFNDGTFIQVHDEAATVFDSTGYLQTARGTLGADGLFFGDYSSISEEQQRELTELFALATPARLRSLRRESHDHGDHATGLMCDDALDDDPEAIGRCAQVLRDAEAARVARGTPPEAA